MNPAPSPGMIELAERWVEELARSVEDEHIRLNAKRVLIARQLDQKYPAPVREWLTNVSERAFFQRERDRARTLLADERGKAE